MQSGQHLLERLGYTVITQTDSLKALKMFRSKPYAFDLVITDQSMPRLTGIRVSRTIDANPARHPHYPVHGIQRND